jgi:L-ribulose-5-phosphate 3-epimerase
MAMRLGYNSNGFAHHRFEDVLPILADIGYESVAITLDHYVLNPFSSDLEAAIRETQALLHRHGLHSVIETGARFLLDPRQKHEPTLVSSSLAERNRRVDFLKKAIDVAAALGSDAVSFWSGPISGTTREQAMGWLESGCRQVLDHAVARGVPLAFEPEPGMLVSRMSEFRALSRIINHELFGLTLDVGHVHCLQDGSIPEVIEQWKGQIRNIHIEDMRCGVHDHLMFGEGEIEFGPLMTRLAEAGYEGGVHVELSRHSHDAVRTAQRAFQFLRQLCR